MLLKSLAVLVALILAGVFTRLGFWQLERRDERLAFNAVVEQRMRLAPVELAELPRDTGAIAYRPVRARGTLDYGQEVVLTSRSHQGSPGVYLFTPLRIAGSDTAVLLNRGWVYAPDGASVELSRWRTDGEGADSLANEVPVGPITTYVQTFPAPQPRPIAMAERPRAVRALDYPQLARRLPYPLATFYLTALPEEAPKPNAPARITQPPLDEGPHLSYAIQWFSFAIVSLVGVGFFVRATRDAGAESGGQGAVGEASR